MSSVKYLIYTVRICEQAVQSSAAPVGTALVNSFRSSCSSTTLSALTLASLAYFETFPAVGGACTSAAAVDCSLWPFSQVDDSGGALGRMAGLLPGLTILAAE